MIGRLFLAGALVAALGVPAYAQETALPGECAVDESATVDVLILLDQSGSLNNTDPGGRRVTGAQTVVRSYATLAERVAQVRVQVAGFGTEFSSSGWQVLDENSRGALLDEVAAAGEQASDFHTDYVYAVDGAIDQFQQSTADCRILFWFTDGAHDLDEGLLGDGLDRFYHRETVTPENVAEVEAQMPRLICSPGGLAHELAAADVSTQVMLLGDGAAMPEASARVLRGMGGDPSFDCGPGNGSFEDVGSADELPFRMACLPQPGALPVPVEPTGESLLVTDQVVAGSGVTPALARDLRIVARGAAGNPPALSRSTLDGVTEFPDAASGTIETSVVLTGQPFEIELAGVVEACAFATVEPPVPVVTAVTPTLYQGEAGEFLIELQGPHGRLEGDALAGMAVDVPGRARSTETGWNLRLDLPEQDTFDLVATVTADLLPPATGTATFDLNEQLHAPRITGHPPALVGEGPGPFQVPLEIDGQDGGELCLGDAPLTALDSEGVPVAVTASLGGERCITVPAGEGQAYTLDIAIERQEFVTGTLDLAYRSVPASRPDTSEKGALALDLELTPVANTALVSAIVAGLLVLLAGLLWATLYGVNRLVGRIPDPRRHGVRFADFTAEIRPGDYGAYEVELVTAPADRDLRTPRWTPSELRAGRLALVRRVSLLPWRAPYAELTAGSDLVAADLGRGVLQRTVLADATVRARPADALGPIVAIGLSGAQRLRLDEGTAQQVPGVLVMDVRSARGMDATAVTRDLLGDALDRIATEFAVQDDMIKERTPGT